MRTHRPQPKTLHNVEIPEELRASFAEALEYLEDASREPDIPIDYGDAIQVGAICGGRTGPPHRPFAFTYYPAGDTRHGRWFLELHETEMQDIADGAKTRLALYCCTLESCRTKFTDESESCFYCDYEDDCESADLNRRIEELADSAGSKEEFVVGYVRLNPDAFGMSLIGAYNQIDGLGERLGWFSLSEAESSIKQAKERDG